MDISLTKVKTVSSQLFRGLENYTNKLVVRRRDSSRSENLNVMSYTSIDVLFGSFRLFVGVLIACSNRNALIIKGVAYVSK